MSCFLALSEKTASLRILLTLLFLSLQVGALLGQTKLHLSEVNIVNLGLRGSAERLVDEQAIAGDPKAGNGHRVYTKFDQTYNSIFNPTSILVKLFEDHYIESLWYYDSNGKDTITVYGGDPSHWTLLGTICTDQYNQWRALSIVDTFKFIRLDFRHPQAAIAEVILYGTPLGTNRSMPPSPMANTPVKMDQFIGINGFVDDPIHKLDQVAGTLREYHRWDWDEGNGQSGYTGFPHNAYAFSPSYVGIWNFDQYYRDLFNKGMLVAPCLQGSPPHIRGPRSEDSKPIKIGKNAEDPLSYSEHADYMFQFAARYGSSLVSPSLLKLRADQTGHTGLGYIQYLENWNEPDKWWKGREGYFSPFELAAMSSADADGHEGALGPSFGMKAADPNMKMVMPGLATLDLQYLEGVRLWSEYNRQNGIPFDVLNFHHYSNNSNSPYGQHTAGLSPEEDQLKNKLKRIVDYRDKWLPGKEIWLSEFGYDSNPASTQGVPAISPYDVLEVQGQWIVRSFLELAASGIDRAQLYMLRDVNNPNPNKYNSSGLTTEKYNGHQEKKSFFYVAGLRHILKNYTFDGEESIGDSELRAYRFKHSESDSICYAIWSGTRRARLINQFPFWVPGIGKAFVQELSDTNYYPKLINIGIQNDSLYVNLSEKPIFVKTLAADFIGPSAKARDINAYLDSMGNAIIKAELVENGSTDDQGIVRRIVIPQQLQCADLPDGLSTVSLPLQYVACDHYQCDTVNFTVQLKDTIGPAVQTKDYKVFLDATGSATVSASNFVDQSWDNCLDSLPFFIDRSSFNCADIDKGGLRSIVSDTSWRKSSYSSMVNANTWPWIGAGDFPADSTYTNSAIAGQAYPWHFIDAVPGSTVLKAGSRIQYFKKTFTLAETVRRASFWITVDDDMEIYLNGKLVARENIWGAPSKGPGAIHGFELNSSGSINGGSNLTPFGLINHWNLSDLFLDGLNELLVVVRNGGPGNLGGFSFKMDLESNLNSTVVSDSNWEHSSLISTIGAVSFPWIGSQEFPEDSSFSKTAQVGQPKPWKTIEPVQGAQVIKSGSYVQFYRKRFEVKGNYWSGLSFWMRVDDDMELFINGHLIAREDVWGNPGLGKGSLHCFTIQEGVLKNGSDSCAGFSFLDANALRYLRKGSNEIVVAVRNTGNGNTGGFSLRLQIQGERAHELNLTASDNHQNSYQQKVYLRVLDTAQTCGPPVINQKGSTSNSTKTLHYPEVKVQVYPNPTKDKIWLSIEGYKEGWLQLQMFNSSGGLVKEMALNDHAKDETIIDLHGLAAGIYLLKVSGAFGEHSQRILKEE